MEEILLRFSHIGQAIFKELNGRDFCKSREVNRQWLYFINNERVLKNSYKKMIQDKVQDLTDEIEGDRYQIYKNQTPFHIAAERGYLPLCQLIIENSVVKNPKDNLGVTPLHGAAKKCHLAVCQLIVRNIGNKNPKCNIRLTPLHWAAGNGHLSICQLIVANVVDKNPKSSGGWTPLHFAAKFGHLSVCQLIIEKVDDKNPKDRFGRTPLDLTQNEEIRKVIQDNFIY